MGFHLHRLYGDALYIIVTSAARTSGDLLASRPLEPDSLDSALASAGLPLMFLDTSICGGAGIAFGTAVAIARTSGT